MILWDLLLEKCGLRSIRKMAETELYGARFNQLRALSAKDHVDAVLACEAAKIARLEAYIAALPAEKMP